jgi:poly(A) polymerase
MALRVIRFWALRRGLYSVNAGYFSGITLSVMVAKICQENPDLYAADLIFKFFETYSDSDWREPVKLNLKQSSSLNANHLSALDRISTDVMVVLVPID